MCCLYYKIRFWLWTLNIPNKFIPCCLTNNKKKTQHTTQVCIETQIYRKNLDGEKKTLSHVWKITWRFFSVPFPVVVQIQWRVFCVCWLKKFEFAQSVEIGRKKARKSVILKKSCKYISIHIACNPIGSPLELWK